MRAVLGVVTAVAVAACGGSGDDVADVVCGPTGGGPHWLAEGETVRFTVTCTTGAPLDGAALVITALPAGAGYDAVTATVTWTTDLDDAAVVMLGLELAGELGTVKIGVADAYDTPGNLPVVDPVAYPEEYGLPVLFLTPGPLDDVAYVPATITYRGHVYTAEAKKRGATSLSYPKNSYTLKFDRGDPFAEPDRAGGFVDKHKIILTSTFDDNSYVRQRLAFDVWNRMDPAHLQVQVYSAVVYLDGAYWGLYLVSDKIDDDLMAAHGLDRAGNLYKARNHDANFELDGWDGAPKTTLHDGYTKEEGLPAEGSPGAFDDLDALVTWAATASDAEFVAERPTRLDSRDFDDWWIFVTLILADDSAGKNSYLYHDPAGGPWRYAPWDFNHSFGQTWQSERQAGDYEEDYAYANRIFARTLAAPSLAAPLYARYREMLDGPLAVGEIDALLDGYLAEIDEAAERDQRKWGQAYRTYPDWSWRDDFTTHAEEVVYLRAWIDQRWAFQRALVW